MYIKQVGTYPGVERPVMLDLGVVAKGEPPRRIPMALLLLEERGLPLPAFARLIIDLGVFIVTYVNITPN